MAGTATPQLEDHLLTWSQGNPLFLRESIRKLVDEGTIGDRNDYSDQPMDLGVMRIPDTVSGMISERIDRLPQAAKELLLTASVLGNEFELKIVSEMTGLPAESQWKNVLVLEGEDFIRETTEGAEDVSFTFCHPLFREVCYNTLVRAKRAQLHAAAFRSLASPLRAGTPQLTERLADQAIKGHLWNEAVTSCRAAGERAIARSAHREAVEHFTNAITALVKADGSGSRLAESIDLRLVLRSAYIPLLNLSAAGRLLDEARELSIQLSDNQRLASVAGLMAGQAYLTRGPRDAAALAQEALTLARDMCDERLEIVPNIYLGQAEYALGNYQKSITVLERNTGLIRRHGGRGMFGLPGRPHLINLYWIAISLSEIGLFERANDLAAQMLGSERDSQPFEVIYSRTAVGFVKMVQGDFAPALEATRAAVLLAERNDIQFMIPVVASQAGWLLSMQGDAKNGVSLARRAVRTAEEIGIYAGRSRWHARLAQALLGAGEPDEAHRQAETAMMIAEAANELGYLSSALQMRAKAAVQLGQGLPEARSDLVRALRIATDLGAQPLIAKCLLDLGLLDRTLRGHRFGRDTIARAAELFGRLDMMNWKRFAELEPDGGHASVSKRRTSVAVRSRRRHDRI